MTEEQCNHCRHSCSYFVSVGDCAYGNDVEDWCCAAEDDPRMRDFDGEGDCPCYDRMEEEE